MTERKRQKWSQNTFWKQNRLEKNKAFFPLSLVRIHFSFSIAASYAATLQKVHIINVMPTTFAHEKSSLIWAPLLAKPTLFHFSGSNPSPLLNNCVCHYSFIICVVAQCNFVFVPPPTVCPLKTVFVTLCFLNDAQFPLEPNHIKISFWKHAIARKKLRQKELNNPKFSFVSVR